VGDDLSVGSNSLAVEGRLCQAPLAHVERFLAREKSFSKNGFRALHDNAAVMEARIPHQHLLHEIRMVELHDIHAKCFETNEIAVSTKIVLQKFGSVFPEDGAVHQPGEESWPRGLLSAIYPLNLRLYHSLSVGQTRIVPRGTIGFNNLLHA
jgi:hypothetical protein